MKLWSSGDGTGSRVEKKLKTIDLSSRKVESCSNQFWNE
jgi:hypothetical protein